MGNKNKESKLIKKSADVCSIGIRDNMITITLRNKNDSGRYFVFRDREKLEDFKAKLENTESIVYKK